MFKNIVIFCSLVVFLNTNVFAEQPLSSQTVEVWKKEVAIVTETISEHRKKGKLKTEEKEVIRKVINTFPEDPAMLWVAYCESTLTHRKGRDLLKNSSGSSAVGAFQILYSVHKKDLQNMKLRITNDSDYFEFARYLYDARGRQPWTTSKNCWKKHAQRIARSMR